MDNKYKLWSTYFIKLRTIYIKKLQIKNVLKFKIKIKIDSLIYPYNYSIA